MSAVRCIAAVLVFCGLAFAQAAWKLPQRNSAATIERKALVARYCQMDSDGFRLDAEKAARMKEAVTWSTVPAVTRFDVVSRVSIAPPKPGAEGLSVTVSYEVLGSYVLGAGYTHDPHKLSVEMEFVQGDDGWRIRDAEQLAIPRVQRARAYRWLRDQIASAKDHDARMILEDAAKQLQPDAGQ